MSETELQKAVMELARLYGWVSYHVPDSRRVTVRGMPDLVMINEQQARLMFVELKTEVGKLRPEQVFWIRVLKSAGVEVHVWRPDDLVETIPKSLRPVKPERSHEN